MKPVIPGTDDGIFFPSIPANAFASKRLSQHPLCQPLAQPARHHHAHSQPHARQGRNEADDLVLFGKGRKGSTVKGKRIPVF